MQELQELPIAIDVDGGDDLAEVRMGVAQAREQGIHVFCVKGAKEGIQALLMKTARAFVSAGNTAEVVEKATRLGRITMQAYAYPGKAYKVQPAVALELPSSRDGHTFVLCDGGGSIEVNEYDLAAFALAGAAYFRELKHDYNSVTRLRVGILAIGEGDEKLLPVDRRCLELLKRVPSFDLISGVEARQVTAGEADVVIRSGYAGNLTLKGVEAGMTMEHDILKQEFDRGFGSRLAGLLVKMIGKRAFDRAKARLDESKFAGGVLCGFEHSNAAIFICHGVSKAKDICAALGRAHRLADEAKRVQRRLRQDLGEYVLDPGLYGLAVPDSQPV